MFFLAGMSHAKITCLMDESLAPRIVSFLIRPSIKQKGMAWRNERSPGGQSIVRGQNGIIGFQLLYRIQWSPLGFGAGLHCMYFSPTPFLRCLFRQLLGEQKSGQKLKGNNLELFQKLKFQKRCYRKKNFSSCGRKFDIWQGHDAVLFEHPIYSLSGNTSEVPND